MNEADIISLAYKIHRNVEGELKLKSEKSNLRRTELEVLLSIDALDSPTTPSEIAKHTGIKLPLVSRVLDSLVKRSILNSSRGNIDRRQNFIILTPEGNELVHSCKAVLGKLPVSLLSTLSEVEKKLLASFLESYSQIL